MRLAAHEYVHTRRERENHLQRSRGNDVLAAVPRGCALESAQPCPSRGWVLPSPVGSEGVPEWRERRSAPWCARPRQPTRAYPGSWTVEPSALTHMLTRVCARDAQAMPRSSSPPPPPASSASLPPSPRAARRFQSPRRRRSDLVLMPAYVCGFRDHGREHRERVCPISACSFAGACSGCPWGAGEPARSTFARSCVRLRVVLGATLAPLGSRMRRCE